MNAQEAAGSEVDAQGSWMLRVAGIASVVLAVGYVAAIPIYALVGDQPAAGVGDQLAYFGGQATGWWSIVVLMVATDLLYVPVFVIGWPRLRALRASSDRDADRLEGQRPTHR